MWCVEALSSQLLGLKVIFCYGRVSTPRCA